MRDFISIALSVVLVVVGLLIGEDAGEKAMQSEAIKHGAAYYHPETGEFTWKGEATE